MKKGRRGILPQENLAQPLSATKKKNFTTEDTEARRKLTTENSKTAERNCPCL